MKVLVIVKAVPDTGARITATDDGSGVTLDGVNLECNAYDEFGLEQALQVGGEITALSVGGAEMDEALRKALALGVGAAVRIEPAAGLDPLGSARLIAAWAGDKGFGLIFAGKQAVDTDQAQMPQLVAELLDWPHATAVSRFEAGDGEVTAVKRFEFGEVTQTVKLPAVISCEKGLNEPRFPSLQGRLKAKKKPIDLIEAGSLGVEAADLAPRIQTEGYENPPEKQPGRILEGDAAEAAAALVKALREEAKVV